MKKINKLLILFCLALTVFSCSSDDDNTQQPQGTNVITLNNETYVVNTVIVEPSVGGNTFISLINKSEAEVFDAIDNGTQLNNINVFNMRINQSSLGEQTYSFSDISNFEFSVNAQIINGELENGDILLDRNNVDTNLNASTGSFTLDLYAVDEIELSFQFTRNDGKIINGSYKGSYISMDNTDG
ncbi:hypothetical protein [Mangrovimonas cancribranchiae]|uniref:DUF4382 domain-containing protein n=1 Tax=Mangrovimonas cancribranchiae TaxID=3080055 RepID=A0AAU6P9L6_9FLAO